MACFLLNIYVYFNSSRVLRFSSLMIKSAGTFKWKLLYMTLYHLVATPRARLERVALFAVLKCHMLP